MNILSDKKILSNLFHDNEEVTEDEIMEMVNEGKEKGVLKSYEAKMIRNIFEFAEKDAKDIMVHRVDIVAIDGEISLREAIRVFEENSFSRIPVYLENLDNIIGVIHLRDMFRYSSRTRDYDRKVRDIDDLIHPAQIVPETHAINKLFTQMQTQKNHLAIVMDEYGQTSGIVSLEDILEEIVGNIQDEHDDEPETVERTALNEFRMTGHTTLEEAGEQLGISFDEEEVTTLNGFLISMLGHIPEEHSSFSIMAKGFTFDVKDVCDRMIGDVVVRRV